METMETTINVNGVILRTEQIDQNVLDSIRLAAALENDPDRPPHATNAKWPGNYPLFPNSKENADMFLTYRRFRNAHEILLHKLEEGQDVTEERDMILVNRIFDMAFYPLKHLSFRQLKDEKNPRVHVVRAFKERNRKRSATKRPFEITVELSDGKEYQLDINKIISRFFDIRDNFNSIMDSSL